MAALSVPRSRQGHKPCGSWKAISHVRPLPAWSSGHGRGGCVLADGGHGWQNQQSYLWKQTAVDKTPGQGQRTSRTVSLWGW